MSAGTPSVPLTGVTLGRRLNIADSEVLAGFAIIQLVVAINGCGVTVEAARQTR